MNRRNFLQSLITFAILPPALTYKRTWRRSKSHIFLPRGFVGEAQNELGGQWVLVSSRSIIRVFIGKKLIYGEPVFVEKAFVGFAMGPTNVDGSALVGTKCAFEASPIKSWHPAMG